MRIACLCPTYGRPSLVRNAVALFMAQTNGGLGPSWQADLWILDDAGQIRDQSGGESGRRWHVVSESTKYPSLPAKYTRLLELAGNVDAYVVWDDDDVYLPWYLQSHARVLQRHAWSHPSRVYSTYGCEGAKKKWGGWGPDTPRIEAAAGRFHGALAMRRNACEAAGGWFQTGRATFDQEMIASLRTHHGSSGDPCDSMPIAYVYRWGDTGRHHCSGVMNREDWYDITPVEEPGYVNVLHPQLDESSANLIRRLTSSRPSRTANADAAAQQ